MVGQNFSTISAMEGAGVEFSHYFISEKMPWQLQQSLQTVSMSNLFGTLFSIKSGNNA